MTEYPGLLTAPIYEQPASALAPRRAERDPLEAKRRVELSLRVGAVIPGIWVGNTVWRIKRRPV